jgi:hypothetical protein
MKKTLLTICMLVGSVIMYAQTTGQVQSYNANSADGGVSDAFYKYAIGSIDEAKKKANFENRVIEGSPYLSNIFQYAQLYYRNEIQGDIYFRYNAYNEEIEIKQQNIESEPIKALTKDKKIRLMVNNKPMSFKTFIDKKRNTKNGYLTLLKDGKYKLYHHLNVTFKDAKKAANSFEKGRPAKFSQNDEYYFENESGKKISQVEFNAKKVLALVANEHKEALQNYLKSEKIKVKTLNDLYKVVEFLNDEVKYRNL